MFDLWKNTTLKFEIPLAEAKEICSVWKNKSIDGYDGWEQIVKCDEIVGIRKRFSNGIVVETHNVYDDDSELFLSIHGGRVRMKIAIADLGGSAGSWRLLVFSDTDFQNGISLEAV